MLGGRKAAGHDPVQTERVSVGLWVCDGNQANKCGFLNWPTRSKCRLCLRPRIREARLVNQWWKASALLAEIVDLATASRDSEEGRAEGARSAGKQGQGRGQPHTRPKAKAAPMRPGQNVERSLGRGPSWADVVQRGDADGRGDNEGIEEDEHGESDEDDGLELERGRAKGTQQRPEPFVPAPVPRLLLQSEYKALEARKERFSTASGKKAEKKKELAESRMREVALQARIAGGLNPGHLPVEIIKVSRKLFSKEKLVHKKEQELEDARARRDEAVRNVEAAERALEDERLRRNNLEQKKAYLTSQHAAESQRQEHRDRVGIALQELRAGGAASFPPRAWEAISVLSTFIETIVPQAAPDPRRNVLEGLASSSSSDESSGESYTTEREGISVDSDRGKEDSGAAQSIGMLSPKEAAARDLHDLCKQRDAEMAKTIGGLHAWVASDGTEETPTSVEAISLAYQERIEAAQRRLQLASDTCEEVPSSIVLAPIPTATSNKRSPPSPTLSAQDATESNGDIGMVGGAEVPTERQPHGKQARTISNVVGYEAPQRGRSNGRDSGGGGSSSEELSGNSRSPRTIQRRKECIAEDRRWRNIEGGSEVLG